MPYTYSDNPVSTGTATQQRDAVRFLIQDTDVSLGKVTDAEIAFALSEEPNVYGAAARCCESLVAQKGNVASRSVGSTAITYDHTTYAEMAKRLRQKSRTRYESPYAGAITITDKDTVRSDTEKVRPDFFKGQNEFAGTMQPNIVVVEEAQR